MPVEIHDQHIAFTLRDPDLHIGAVKLLQEVARPRLGPEFVRFAGSDSWTLYFPRPEADRMEYQLQLNHPDGGTELVCDPTNPLQAEGPFGPKSVLEFPGYEPPAWVGSDAPANGTVEQEIKSRALRRRLRVAVWSAPDTEPAEPLPLLVAHDGPEYAEYSQLLVLLTKNSRSGTIPPMRAALLQPVDRDEIYSASSTYARALAHDILPALSAVAPTPHGRKMRIGMGASLGALAMLHVHRRNPAAFGALFLQSGSYFRPRSDPQESGFGRFRRISRFVGQVLSAEAWAHPIRITMTCGTAEENLGNNRVMRDALEGQDYEVDLHEHRDAHNWISWRDTFDPHLIKLLQDTWG